MSPHNQARARFRAIRGKPALIKLARDSYAAAAVKFSSLQVTSGTENGQSFTGSYSSDTGDDLVMLERLMWMIDNDSTIPNTTIPRHR